MLLPPMSDRIATPAGLRAYPRQPELTDAEATATRREATTYVVEEPGAYRLPALAVDWWNTATGSVETAATDAIAFDVPAPAGWHDATTGEAARGRRGAALGLAAALAAAAALILWRRRHPKARSAGPTERSLYRDLRRAVRRDPPAKLRPRLARWLGRLDARRSDHSPRRRGRLAGPRTRRLRAGLDRGSRRRAPQPPGVAAKPGDTSHAGARKRRSTGARFLRSTPPPKPSPRHEPGSNPQPGDRLQDPGGVNLRRAWKRAISLAVGDRPE